jgi:1,4-dihydroxy-2-naphthoate octaprenyltransferase
MFLFLLHSYVCIVIIFRRGTLLMKMFKLWLSATRPKTLWAAVSPVIIGLAMAWDAGQFNWAAAAVTLLTALLIQIGTNFANDYYDYIKGADTEERFGPQRLTQAKLVKPQTMKNAFILVFMLAFLCGLYLVFVGGWPILLIGIFSILFGILYTGGPYPLGYNGLGEIFVFVFFGPVAVAGTYYIHTHQINSVVIAAGIAPGLIASAILVVNNLRDIKSDALAHKKTVAVRFGEKFTQVEYLLIMIFAALTPFIIFLIYDKGIYSLFSSLFIIFAIPSIKKVFSIKGKLLNEVLSETGKLLLIYTIIFSLGWIF